MGICCVHEGESLKIIVLFLSWTMKWTVMPITKMKSTALDSGNITNVLLSPSTDSTLLSHVLVYGPSILFMWFMFNESGNSLVHLGESVIWAQRLPRVLYLRVLWNHFSFALTDCLYITKLSICFSFSAISFFLVRCPWILRNSKTDQCHIKI